MAEYDPPLVHLPGTVLTPEVVLHRTLNKVHRMQRRCVASSLATFSTPLLRCLSGAKWSGSASKRSELLCSSADRWAPLAKSAIKANKEPITPALAGKETTHDQDRKES